MAPTDYTAYLRSDDWRKVRARYRRSRRPQHCLVCGDRDVQLHHVSYDRLGEERLDDLVPLCDRHHAALHRYARERPYMSLRLATVRYVRHARLLDVA